MVQVQRRIEALASGRSYSKHHEWRPLFGISRDLQHAVIAAEDARFYQHWGIDWEAVRDAAEESLERGRFRRGGSTLTQQLVKNLFLTTHSNPLRKLVEAALTPPADLILGKQRILELYLNEIEWGPGVYGAEAAAGYHYRTSADRLTRDQAARLAACIPAPARRRPAKMNQYSDVIETRMRQMGW
jgi:monofunctional biosynthetic peptidoglycan transglycosylase